MREKVFSDYLAQKIQGGNKNDLLNVYSLIARMEKEAEKRNQFVEKHFLPKESQVGIWKRSKSGNYLRVANLSAQLSSLWSSVEVIPKKSSKVRIVFLGESVARGWGYEETFSPAIILGDILNFRAKNDAYEVVDLSSTSITRLGLNTLVQECIQLEPDILVIYAGNNWHWTNKFLDSIDQVVALEMLESRRFREYISFMESRLRVKIQEHIKHVLDHAGSIGTKNIYYILPESNLADWQNPAGFPPWLDNKAYMEWVSEYKKGVKLIANGSYEEASKVFKSVIELDNQTSALSLFSLATCQRVLGNKVTALRNFRKARDMAVWDHTFDWPSCPSLVPETIEACASCEGFNLVDIPSFLEKTLDDSIPDKRIFLDYCHMNHRGISRVMELVARKILKRDVSEGSHGGIREPQANHQVEALTMAAIHNAHYNQAYNNVQYYCDQAASISIEQFKRITNSYASLQLSHCKPLLNGAYFKLLNSDLRELRKYLLKGNAQSRHFDKRLMDEFVSACGGSEGSGGIYRLQQEFGLGKGQKIDLVETYYNQNLNSWWEEREGRKFYQSLQEKIEFFFSIDDIKRIDFDIALRSGSFSRRSRATIKVNGMTKASESVSDEWKAISFYMNRKNLKDVNSLTIEWKVGMNELLSGCNLPQVIDRQHFGALTERPVYGEVYSIMLSGN